MKKCSKCGKEIGIGMFSLVSDMCDDCYEKANYYTPDFDYIKEGIIKEFWLPDGQYSPVDLMVFFSECEKKVHDEIGNQCVERKKHFATIFREFDETVRMKELIQTNHFLLEYSYFFADDKLDTVPCFADRKKHRSVIIR